MRGCLFKRSDMAENVAAKPAGIYGIRTLSVKRPQTNRRAYSRGSFTVEAAVIVPLLVFMIAALISLCFFVHDRVWYTGAACEAALAANMAEDAAGEAQERVEQRLADHVIPGALPDADVSAGKNGATVAFTGRRSFGLPWELPAWEAGVHIRRIRPAGILQNWWAAKRFGRVLTEDDP